MSPGTKIFGASLDPLDGLERVEIKRAYTSAVCAGIDIQPDFLDPYEGICSANPDLFDALCEKAGKVPIETWLAPKPEPEDLPKITSDNYKVFLENNGCYQYSTVAGQFLGAILPNFFVMIGVDHSQTGGIVRRLSTEYGPDRISLVVLDAHTDMFDFNLLYAIQGELLRKQGFGGRLPKTLYANDFYGCGSFLRSLIDEGAILPGNLFLIGVTDHPGQHTGRSEDSEIVRYVDAYGSILRQGIHVLSKADVESSIERVSEVLSAIRTPYVYLSIDMDVGAFLTTCAVRFLNTVGITEDCLYKLVKTFKDVVNQKNVHLVGMDLMELDVHYAGYTIAGERDKSYEIAGDLIRMLVADQ
jgi:arginase family enzyme